MVYRLEVRTNFLVITHLSDLRVYNHPLKDVTFDINGSKVLLKNVNEANEKLIDGIPDRFLPATDFEDALGTVYDLTTLSDFLYANVGFAGSGSVGGNTDITTLSKEARQVTTNNYLELDNWDSIPGNNIEYTYYTGAETNNPSGTGNIKDIIYKKNAVTEFTKTYVFNANDDIINTIVT